MAFNVVVGCPRCPREVWDGDRYVGEIEELPQHPHCSLYWIRATVQGKVVFDALDNNKEDLMARALVEMARWS